MEEFKNQIDGLVSANNGMVGDEETMVDNVSLIHRTQISFRHS